MSDKVKHTITVEIADDELVLGSIVLYKVMTASGAIVYREGYDADLSIMERLGMTTSAQRTCEDRIQQTARPGD